LRAWSKRSDVAVSRALIGFLRARACSVSLHLPILSVWRKQVNTPVEGEAYDILVMGFSPSSSKEKEAERKPFTAGIISGAMV